MVRARLLGSKGFLFAPILLLLIIAVACGDDATPAPTATTAAAATATTAPTATTAAAATATTAPTATTRPAPTATLRRGETPRPTPTPAPTPTTTVVQATPTPTQEAVMSKASFVDPLELAGRYGDKPRVGGTMIAGNFENWPHYDWQQGAGGNSSGNTSLVNGLVMSNPYDWPEIMPDVAYDWEVNPEFTKYTFFLHEGVRFHDGVEAAAEEFRYSLERIRTGGVFPDDPEERTCPACRGALLAQLVKSFEVPDKYTLVINTEGPTTALLALLAGGYYSVIPPHINELDRRNALRDDRTPVGTGPFMMAEDATTILWKQERNPDYFKPGLPFLDGHDIHLILDIQTRATAVLTQRIFWNHSTSAPFLDYQTASALAEQDPGIVHTAIPAWLMLLFTLNSNFPPLDDIRVRQALSEGIDRSDLMTVEILSGVEGIGGQRGIFGTTIPGNSPWAPPKEWVETYIGYGPDMEVRRQHARDLLADYEGENGPIDWGDVPYNCATQHASCDQATIIQSQLKKIGVELELQAGEIISTWQKQVDGQTAISGLFGIIDFDDPVAFPAKHWLGNADLELSFVRVPEADVLYQELLTVTNLEEQKRLAWEIDKLYMDTAGSSVSYWGVAEHIQRDFVKGFTGHPDLFGTHSRLEGVWLDLPEFPLAE